MSIKSLQVCKKWLKPLQGVYTQNKIIDNERNKLEKSACERGNTNIYPYRKTKLRSKNNQKH